MFVQFRFKNYRSFYKENVLFMQAGKDKELKELNTFTVSESLLSNGENELLKSAVIFGNNASGKSNVLKAISYMKQVVLNSSSQMPIIKENEYFAFYQDAYKEESLYEVEIIENNIFYRYGFSIQEGVIKEEWLDRRKERLIHVFKRKDNELNILGIDKNKVKYINLNSSTLFLSIGRNLKLSISDDIQNVFQWFSQLLVVFGDNVNVIGNYTLENNKYLNQALQILKFADIGIQNIAIKKTKLDDMNYDNNGFSFNFPSSKFSFNLTSQIKREANELYDIDMATTFNVYDSNKNVVDQKEILLFKNQGFNSEGTRRLLCCLGFLLSSLNNGTTIFLDEIDTSFHYLVAYYLIRMFNSIYKNPNNAQLICTAHNVSLMDGELRRDQIYFTSKDEYGESELFSLYNFKNVRKNDLFSKKYLAGFYTPVPDIYDIYKE